VGIDLLANIEIPDDIATARGNGAAGVGLYRTEFLYMNRDSLPDEEEQLDAYRRVVEGMGAIPVTIRTLDLGVDKQAEGHPLPCPAPCNPALGLRAIRLCLREPELFRPQLRAILRASALGPVRLMIPMLSSLQELASVLRLIEETKQALQSEGLAFDPDIPVGGMIEVPAAALAAGSFARRLDFLSIGTNDLIQYTLAIDRVDEAVTYLYDPLHPAILRLIRMVIEAGQRQGIPVGMCGEMAGDPRFTRLLLGMGLREFSMQPRALLEVKAVIRESNVAKLAQDIEELLAGLDGFDAESLAQRVDALNPKRLH
jgi:phosphotransferase system enzyme I (PtsI)